MAIQENENVMHKNEIDPRLIYVLLSLIDKSRSDFRFRIQYMYIIYTHCYPLRPFQVYACLYIAAVVA
jgi:hypothetical protein